MARTPAQLAQKWSDSWKLAVPDMQTAYSQGIASAVTAWKKFATDLGDPSAITNVVIKKWVTNIQGARSKVETRFTAAYAGVRYTARTEILKNSPADLPSKDIMESTIVLRRHITSITDDVITLLEADTSKKAIFKAGLNAVDQSLQRIIVNQSLVAISFALTNTSTPAQAHSAIATNIENTTIAKYFQIKA